MTRPTASWLFVVALAVGCGGSGTEPDNPPENNGHDDTLVDPPEVSPGESPDPGGLASPQEVFAAFQQELAAKDWAKAASRLDDVARTRWTHDLLAHARGLVISARNAETAESLTTLMTKHGVDVDALPRLYVDPAKQSRALKDVADRDGLLVDLVGWIDEHPVESIPPLDLSSRFQGHLDVGDPIGEMAIGVHTVPPFGVETSRAIKFTRKDDRWRVDPFGDVPEFLPRPEVTVEHDTKVTVDLSTPLKAAETYRRAVAVGDREAVYATITPSSARVRFATLVGSLAQNGLLQEGRPHPDLPSLPDFDWTPASQVFFGGRPQDAEKVLDLVPDPRAAAAELAAWAAETRKRRPPMQLAPEALQNAMPGEVTVQGPRARVALHRVDEEWGSLTGRYADAALVLIQEGDDWFVDEQLSQRDSYIAPRHTSRDPDLVREIIAEGPVTELVFSPKGDVLYGVERSQLTKWDVESGRQLWRKNHANRIAVSPDGATIAVGEDGFSEAEVHLYDAETGDPIRLVGKHEGMVSSVHFLDDDTLLTCAWDDTARVWSLGAAPEETQRFETGRDGHASARVSLDGRYLLAGDRSAPIRVWDLTSGEALEPITAEFPKGPVFREDGRIVLVTDVDTYTREYRGRDGGPIHEIRVIDLATREEVSIDVVMRTGHIVDVAVTPDGRFVFLQTEYDVLVWDAEARRIVADYSAHSRRIEALALSPDGKLLATGPGTTVEEHRPDTPSAVRLWKVPER